MANSAVIDSDGHILEPPDLWEKYLEPKYRDRAIRLRVDERGLGVLRDRFPNEPNPTWRSIGRAGRRAAYKNPVKELREHIAQMSVEDQDWILGKSAVELYRL